MITEPTRHVVQMWTATALHPTGAWSRVAEAWSEESAYQQLDEWAGVFGARFRILRADVVIWDSARAEAA